MCVNYILPGSSRLGALFSWAVWKTTNIYNAPQRKKNEKIENVISQREPNQKQKFYLSLLERYIVQNFDSKGSILISNI